MCDSSIVTYGFCLPCMVLKIYMYQDLSSCSCSSMVPGSRNPMWGEEFNFSVDELPVEVVILH